jgi:hypothetical protein
MQIILNNIHLREWVNEQFTHLHSLLSACRGKQHSQLVSTDTLLCSNVGITHSRFQEFKCKKNVTQTEYQKGNYNHYAKYQMPEIFTKFIHNTAIL